MTVQHEEMPLDLRMLSVPVGASWVVMVPGGFGSGSWWI